MKHDFTFKFLKLLLISALVGCGKGQQAVEESEVGHDDSGRDNGVVTLSQENLQHVEIGTEPASLGVLETTLKAAGRVTENMNKTAHVSSQLEGRIERLNFDIGDEVKAGDTLAVVQTPELLGKPLEIKSPLAGIVTDRKATVGELVDKSTMICTISDPADLWVIAEIKERDIAAVRADQPATFSVLAYPGTILTGEVVRIANQVESDTRTLEVRIAVDNRDGKLKPGMFADVEITITVTTNILVIPDTALQTDENDKVVFVALDNTSFQKRAVKTGMEHQGRVEILGGLKPGEVIVTQGSFILKSELLKGELGEE
jgi:cobalt-zinc-cadmium efflux system membrane fusion protein